MKYVHNSSRRSLHSVHVLRRPSYLELCITFTEEVKRHAPQQLHSADTQRCLFKVVHDHSDGREVREASC